MKIFGQKRNIILGDALSKSGGSFTMKLKGFIPLGFFVAFFSTLIGATGPVLNPFYLNYGIEKETMIATKTINSFFIRMVQIATFTALGVLHGNLWLYGIALGIGASAGNWIGKRFLRSVSSQQFRKLVIAVMVISGALMVIRQAIILFK